MVATGGAGRTEGLEHAAVSAAKASDKPTWPSRLSESLREPSSAIGRQKVEGEETVAGMGATIALAAGHRIPIRYKSA